MSIEIFSALRRSHEIWQKCQKSHALLGPIAGKLTNQYGSKSGTIVACLLHAIWKARQYKSNK